jgi:NitT/TauT family transport system substrate-binding protein
MRVTFNNIKTATLAVGLSMTGALSVAAEELTVRLDFSPWGVHAAMHLAQQKGWFADEGLEIDIQDGKGTSNTIQLVGTGNVDVGQVQLGLMALARENGLPLKSFAGFVRRSDMAVLVDASSDIRTVKDLAGKDLVSFTASPWIPYINSFLENGGISKDDLSILMVAPPAMVGTYVSGEADGFMTVGPFGLPLVENTRPARQILMADYGVTFPSYGLIALEDTLDARGDELAKLAAVQQRAWTYIFDGHIDEAVDAIIAARPDNGLNPDVLRGQIISYRPFFDTERTAGLPFGVQSKDDWADAIASMETAGIIEPGQNAEDFFTNDLLPN